MATNAAAKTATHVSAKSPAHRRKRWKIVIPSVIVFLALVWAVLFLGYGRGFYQTVDEIKQAGSVENVRVGGQVSQAGLEQDGDTVRFVLRGEWGAELPVVYRGAYPERLGPYEQVVVTGSAASDGTFVATEVLVKCPSRFLPERLFNKAVTGAGLERVLY